MDQSGCLLLLLLLLLWRLYSLPCSVPLWSSSPGPRKGPEEGPFRLRCTAASGLPPWATARPPRTRWGRTWAPGRARCPRCRPRRPSRQRHPPASWSSEKEKQSTSVWVFPTYNTMYSFIYLLRVYFHSQACLFGGAHFQDVPKDRGDPGFGLPQMAEGLPGVDWNQPLRVGDGPHGRHRHPTHSHARHLKLVQDRQVPQGPHHPAERVLLHESGTEGSRTVAQGALLHQTHHPLVTRQPAKAQGDYCQLRNTHTHRL